LSSSSTQTQVDELRKIIADEALPLAERKAVAEHLVQIIVDAVSAPADDHAGVVALMTPPEWDGPMAEYQPTVQRILNEQRGWASSGPMLPQAKRYVHNGLKFVALLAVVVDGEAHRLERLEACRRVLEDYLSPRNFYRENHYDAEKMLSKVLPATALKWGAWDKGKVPVVRPPQCMADVWEP
jgi:hypothetical protein